jgi:hypothetical protein
MGKPLLLCREMEEVNLLNLGELGLLEWLVYTLDLISVSTVSEHKLRLNL